MFRDGGITIMRYDGPFLEPREEILKKIKTIPNEPEMSVFESGFLCGLLRTYKPKKIVEVGVAGGGLRPLYYNR